jgi:hypothetical protein
LAADCDGFISKPVQAEALLEQLGKHLRLEWVDEENDAGAIAASATRVGRTLAKRGVSDRATTALASCSVARDERENLLDTSNWASSRLLSTGATGANANSLQTSIVAPPPEELAALHELAMMGDIRGIQQQAMRLEQLDEQFVPFAQQVRQLAKGFQEKQILEFVKKYMAGNE